MHVDRKDLRAFPCKPFAFACFEHSIDSALRAFFGVTVLEVEVFGAVWAGVGVV
jgi:hypothetical protein